MSAPEPALLYPQADWNPIPYKGGGFFQGLRPFKGKASKVTLHTTETSVKPNWERQQTGIPHFTLHLAGYCWQHLPLGRAAYTLKGGLHSPNSDSGVNIQVEVIGYARDSQKWTDAQYKHLADLLRWISTNAGVPLVAPVPFAANARRLQWSEWESTSGVLGHCHVPYNDHTDPGALRVDKALGASPAPPTPDGTKPTYLSKLHSGQLDSDSVRNLQRALNAHKLAAPGNITLPVTGYFGRLTEQVVVACQQQHGTRWGQHFLDKPGRVNVGPKQAAHLGLPDVR